jgi:hypothetical protein
MHAVLFEAAYAAPDGRKRSTIRFFAGSSAEAERVAREKQGAGVLAGMNFVALAPRHPVETRGLQRVPLQLKLALPAIDPPAAAVWRRSGCSSRAETRGGRGEVPPTPSLDLGPAAAAPARLRAY